MKIKRKSTIWNWIDNAELHLSLYHILQANSRQNCGSQSDGRVLWWRCLNCAAPRLAAFPLKCFTWLLETGVTGSIILPKLKKDNLITKVIANCSQLNRFQFLFRNEQILKWTSFDVSYSCAEIEADVTFVCYRHFWSHVIVNHRCTFRNMLMELVISRIALLIPAFSTWYHLQL
jgi:hypothetical protein